MSAKAILTPKEIIDRIFKEPGIKFELTEFETLGKPIHDIIEIYPKTMESGRDAGKTKYFLKSFIPMITKFSWISTTIRNYGQLG